MASQPELKGESLFSVHFVCWRIMGMIPSKRNRNLYYAYSFVANVLITIGYPLHLLIGLLQSKTLYDIMKNMSICLVCSVCSMKTFAIWLNFGIVLKIIEIIRRQDRRIETPDEIKYYRTLVFPAVLRILKLFYAVGIGASSTSELMVLVNGLQGNWRLMYPAYFPFDPFGTSFSYLIAHVYQIVSVSFQLLQNLVNDTYTGMHLALLSGQTRLLGMRVAKIGHDSRKTLEENNQELLRCIQDHKDLLEYRSKLEELTAFCMFFQILFAGINFCVVVVFIILFASDPFTLMYYAVYLGSMVAEVLPSCYYGSIMELEFQNLTYFLFSSNWMDQDLRFKKNLLIFAEQANKPLYLMAWIFRVNLNSFLAACKNSYSLFAVIMNVK